MSKRIAGPVNENWKSAFIGAIGIHLVLVVFSIVAPNLWERSRPIPQVYTVKLFETVDLPSPKIAKPKKQAPIVTPKPKIQKSKKKEAKVVPLPKKPKPKKAVSLRPKKPKATKKHKPKPVVTKDAEKLLSKRLKNIKERVKEKESEALIKNRLNAIRSSVEAKTKKTATTAAGTGAGSGQQNEVLRLYCTEIWAKVRNHWVLPEQLLDKTGLTSIVVVRIAQDGSILKAEHEHKSGHTLFDQSAIKAVQKASPFPPLPRALRPGPLEIGIRFRPGEVGL
ncbi:MAG: energy transducer TonB [Thermodesulfobacteriota bacterium]|nr:energy transducer TonB [Thermodesulfobacteriota bacterium]